MPNLLQSSPQYENIIRDIIIGKIQGYKTKLQVKF